MRHAVLLVATMTALAMLLAAAPGARADDSAWKAAHDTDPHLPLTAQQLDAMAQKRALEPQGVSAPFALSPVGWSECASCTNDDAWYPSSASLPETQIAQVTNYYCGPAAVHEALDAIGISLSQSAAADELNTTTDGTAWSGGGTSPSGYPVPDVLNRHQSRNDYIPQYVSSATSSAISTYEKDLKIDIYALGVPLIGDAWETRYSDYHLVGHPTDRTIFHWFEIRGYKNSGGSTMYEDSVHNASSISWSGGVPAYSTLPSSWIVSIVAGRGYVW